MAKTVTASEDLTKGAKVVASTELRGVPEGTAGKVIMVSGISWIRYWVLFENGVRLGSINRSKLATPDEWRRHLSGEDPAGESAEASDGEAGIPADGVEAASGEGKTTPSGTMVPQLLLDRSAAARARLGG